MKTRPVDRAAARLRRRAGRKLPQQLPPNSARQRHIGPSRTIESAIARCKRQSLGVASKATEPSHAEAHAHSVRRFGARPEPRIPAPQSPRMYKWFYIAPARRSPSSAHSVLHRPLTGGHHDRMSTPPPPQVIAMTSYLALAAETGLRNAACFFPCACAFRNVRSVGAPTKSRSGFVRGRERATCSPITAATYSGGASEGDTPDGRLPRVERSHTKNNQRPNREREVERLVAQASLRHDEDRRCRVADARRTI